MRGLTNSDSSAAALFTFVALLGGNAVFGLKGLILGPLIPGARS